jgi:ribosomal protein L35
MKTSKSLKKRVKITGTGKILKRRARQNHFNAKDSGDFGRAKKSSRTAPKGLIKHAKALLKNI